MTKQEFDNEFSDEGSGKSSLPLRSFEFNAVGKDIPLYKESMNQRGGFINFGSDNLMPNYYISLLDRSPKHNAIVHQKASMIGGNGFVKTGLSNAALNFIANMTNDDDLEEIAAKISVDLEVHGAFLLNIVWSKDRTKIAEINYMNPQTMRIVAPNPEYPQIEEYWISKDWGNTSKKSNYPVKYPGFSVRDRSNPNQLLYVKTYQPGKYFYGVPEYISGARWIEMEYEISDFHLKNIKNGFAPSMFINFPGGIPTDEEMALNDKKLMRELAGPKGGGKAFITYSENKDTAPTISPIESNSNDSKYIELNDIITEGILGAHRVNDPALFGLAKDAGIFAGQTQILNSLEMFRSQYIVPKQRFIEKAFNRLARINGITDKLELAEYSLNFAKMDVSIADVLSILNSQISYESKHSMLVINGYTEEDASKILGPNVSATPITNASIKHDQTSAEEAPVVNDAVKNLTAKQHQQLIRIIRQYSKGQITKEVATVLLKTGLGLSQSDIDSMLPDTEDDINEDKNNTI